MGAELLMAGANIAGSIIQSKSADKASARQAAATNAANALQKSMYDQTRADNMPALDARNASLTKLQQLLGIGGDANASDYGSVGAINTNNAQNEAGYQFGLDQGLKAQQAQMTARGMRNSGAAAMAAGRYGTDYATTKTGESVSRQIAAQNALLSPYQTLAGIGQSGASTVAGAGSNYAQTVGNNTVQQGDNSAAAALAQGNALTGAVNQIGGWYQAQQNPLKGTNAFSGNGMLQSYGNY